MQMNSVFLDQIASKFKYRCVICSRKYFGLHHIIPRSMGGEDNEENLVTLCQFHHREVHNTGALNWVKRLSDLRKKRLQDFET